MRLLVHLPIPCRLTDVYFYTNIPFSGGLLSHPSLTQPFIIATLSVFRLEVRWLYH